MDDKSTAAPICICEDVPVEVANCLILADFVVLDMPEDGSMPIILDRPFLNTAGAIIDCNKGEVTFNVNDERVTPRLLRVRIPGAYEDRRPARNVDGHATGQLKALT